MLEMRTDAKGTVMGTKLKRETGIETLSKISVSAALDVYRKG
jgi:hypothetical protein